MHPFSFSIDGISAWAPEHDTLETWRAWAEDPRISVKPLGDGTFDEKKLARWVEPMLRRRSRKLSRAMLELAGRLTTPDQRSHIASVFAHRYGEAETTLPLLCDLAEGKALSPMGFSLSVHNTASGLFSIAAANRSPTTSISAGKNTFTTGLLTALTYVQTYGECLFLVGDEKLSEIYTTQPYVLDEPQQFYALGMLLSKSGRNSASFECQAAATPEPPVETPVSQTQTLRFLHALLCGDSQIHFNDDGFNYCLRFNAAPLQDIFVGAHATGT